jgi:uncharacterized damage-inducible protein DinB
VSAPDYAPLAITPMWARVNDELVELVDRLSDEQLNWSPKPELWNTRGIMLHICVGRHGMMQAIVEDGLESPDILGGVQTRAGMKEQLAVSWERMMPFLTSAEQLAREYPTEFEGKTVSLSGHWLAFGQLEHDVHHRADIIHYLGLLGVEHPEPDSVERHLRELVAAT